MFLHFYMSKRWRCFSCLEVVELFLIFVAIEDSLKSLWVFIRISCSSLEKLNIAMRARSYTFFVLLFIFFRLKFIQILFRQISRTFDLTFNVKSYLWSLLWLYNWIVFAGFRLPRYYTAILIFYWKVGSCSIRPNFFFHQLLHRSCWGSHF